MTDGTQYNSLSDEDAKLFRNYKSVCVQAYNLKVWHVQQNNLVNFLINSKFEWVEIFCGALLMKIYFKKAGYMAELLGRTSNAS